MQEQLIDDRVLSCHRQLWDLVRGYWEPNHIFGHGADHAKRTYQLGKRLCRLEKGNFLLVGAACYLMDAGLNTKEGREGHIERSINIALDMLPRISQLSAYEVTIIACIANHDAGDDFSPDVPFEARVVRDCDTLDRMGFPGVRMTLRYGTWINRPLHHQFDPLCVQREPDLNGYTLDYIRYLFELQSWLSTQTAQKIAMEKTEQLKQFMLAFQYQLSNSDVSYEDAFNLVDQLQDKHGDPYAKFDD